MPATGRSHMAVEVIHSTSSLSSRMSYLPALDGLRGVAVTHHPSLSFRFARMAHIGFARAFDRAGLHCGVYGSVERPRLRLKNRFQA
jgi:hypothetical protein